MEAAILIIIVILLIAIFAFKSEIKSYKDIQRIVPAWEVPPEEKEEQLTSLACYASDVRVAWRTALLGTVVSVFALWLLSGLNMTVGQILAVGITVFVVFYFFSSFAGYHYFKEVCKKARPNWVKESPEPVTENKTQESASSVEVQTLVPCSNSS